MGRLTHLDIFSTSPPPCVKHFFFSLFSKFSCFFFKYFFRAVMRMERYIQVPGRTPHDTHTYIYMLQTPHIYNTYNIIYHMRHLLLLVLQQQPVSIFCTRHRRQQHEQQDKSIWPIQRKAAAAAIIHQSYKIGGLTDTRSEQATKNNFEQNTKIMGKKIVKHLVQTPSYQVTLSYVKLCCTACYGCCCTTM